MACHIRKSHMFSQAFNESRLIRNLSKTQADRLFSQGEVIHRPAASILINEGDILDNLYIILAGKVLVFLPKTGNRVTSVRLSTLKKGDCFGEYAFVDQRPASASVLCSQDSVLYQLPHSAFTRFLSEHTDAGCIVYRDLLNLLVTRLRLNNAELDIFQTAVS